MTTRDLHKLFTKNKIDIDRYDEVVNTLDLIASKEFFRVWINKFLLWIGGLFLISGLLFFFAYNWNNLDKFSKLSIPIVIIFISAIIAIKNNLDAVISQVAIFIIIIAIGISWTLFGQIYQTGADAWNLFFAWSLFTFAIVIVSTTAIHWFIWLFITNLAISLYTSQVIVSYPTSSLIAVGIFTIISTTFIYYYFIKHLKLKSFQWLLDLNLIYFITIFSIILINEAFNPHSMFKLLILLYIPVVLLYLQHKNLIIVSATILSIIVVTTSFSTILATSIGKIVIGTFTLIGSSWFLITYLVQRIKNAKPH